MENILNWTKYYVATVLDTIGNVFVQARVSFHACPVPLRGLVKQLKGSLWFPMVWLIPLLAIMMLFFRVLPWIQDVAPILVPPVRSASSPVSDSLEIASLIEAEQAEISKLEKDLNKLTPRSAYLVVNTTNNTFRLYRGNTIMREGVCSTGSYTLLTDGKEKKWYFQTPKGSLRIRHKTTNPVWKKPDWAFVEEGLPLPPANHPSRIEYGTLGDYALGLGDGYLIHGTLYQRFLGMPVTHGCIRLGDDDLEAVFKTLQVGSQVFIY